jgi:hypothetical protein
MRAGRNTPEPLPIACSLYIQYLLALTYCRLPRIDAPSATYLRFLISASALFRFSSVPWNSPVNKLYCHYWEGSPTGLVLKSLCREEIPDLRPCGILRDSVMHYYALMG